MARSPLDRRSKGSITSVAALLDLQCAPHETVDLERDPGRREEDLRAVLVGDHTSPVGVGEHQVVVIEDEAGPGCPRKAAERQEGRAARYPVRRGRYANGL